MSWNDNKSLSVHNILQYPPGPHSTRLKISEKQKQAETSSEPKIDIEEIENNVKPVYLRESSVFNAYVKFKEKQEYEQMLKMTFRDDQEQPRFNTPKWRVDQPDLNAWRKNTIDSKNIYSAKAVDQGSEVEEDYDDDSVLDSDYLSSDDMDGEGSLVLPVMARPPLVPLRDPLFNRERSYIQETRANIRSPEMSDVFRFWAKSFSTYNIPKDNNQRTSYCSPRYVYIREKSKDALQLRRSELEVEKITRVPGHLKILPRLLNADACRNNECVGKQFCDVLGPETCGACVEFARKTVGQEVQKEAFPELDFTVTTLVAPELAKYAAISADSFRTSREGRSRRSSRKSSRRNSTAAAGIMRLPSISEQRYGRAGVERFWEEKARKYRSKAAMNGAYPLFI